MKYEIRVFNRKTGGYEWLTVDFAGYKFLYWSYYYDILDVHEVKE